MARFRSQKVTALLGLGPVADMQQVNERFEQIVAAIDEMHSQTYSDLLTDRTIRRTTAIDYTCRSRDSYVGITNTDAARTVTLPPLSKVVLNHVIQIKDESGGAASNNITVDGDGSETIDGAANSIIGSDYGEVMLLRGRDEWHVVGGGGVKTSGDQNVAGAKTFTDILTMAANIVMGGNKITGLGDGTASGDALHAGQVDGVTIGLNGSDQLEVPDGGIANAQIAAAAAIAISKLATGGVIAKVDTYTGDGQADHEITVGFQPVFVMVSRPANNYDTILRIKGMASGYSRDMSTRVLSTNRIKTFTSTGFTLGTNAYVNTNTYDYDYIAIGVNS